MIKLNVKIAGIERMIFNIPEALSALKRGTVIGLFSISIFFQMSCRTGRNESVYRILSGKPKLIVQDKIVVVLWAINVSGREFKESEICGDYSLLEIKEASHLGSILTLLLTGTLIFFAEREFVCGEIK